jgi:hypothetical protein
MALFAGTLKYTGGRLDGFKKQAEEDTFEWKMEMRRNKRRPLEETIAELGEGRGTFECGQFCGSCRRHAHGISPDIITVTLEAPSGPWWLKANSVCT